MPEEPTNHKLPGAFDLFGPSWHGLRLNFWTFVLIVLVPVLLITVPALIFLAIDASGSSSHTAITGFDIAGIIFGVLALLAVAFIFTVLLYVLKWQSAKGVKMGVRQVWRLARGYKWRMIRLFILRNLVIGVGFVLLIVPGFYMWRRYMLAPYYLLDKNLSVGDALRQSAADSKPFSSAIWGMMGLYTLLLLLQIIPLLGYLAVIPSCVYCCAQALRYFQIQKAKA